MIGQEEQENQERIDQEKQKLIETARR